MFSYRHTYIMAEAALLNEKKSLKEALTKENNSLKEELRRTIEREKVYEDEIKFYEDEKDELMTELAMIEYLKTKSCERLEKKLEKKIPTRSQPGILFRSYSFFEMKRNVSKFNELISHLTQLLEMK